MNVYPVVFSGIMVVLKRKTNISNSSKQLLYAVRGYVCQTFISFLEFFKSSEKLALRNIW